MVTMTRNCRCNGEQKCLWVYDEIYDDYNPNLPEPGKFGAITGVVLCKIRCLRCGEIYLSEVPVLKFTDESPEADTIDGDREYEDDGEYDEDEDDDRPDEWSD